MQPNPSMRIVNGIWIATGAGFPTAVLELLPTPDQADRCWSVMWLLAMFDGVATNASYDGRATIMLNSVDGVFLVTAVALNARCPCAPVSFGPGGLTLGIACSLNASIYNQRGVVADDNMLITVGALLIPASGITPDAVD